MADTSTCGNGADKLYLFSGALTSTLKTSQLFSVSAISGSQYDQTNSLLSDYGNSKIYVASGQFTSTIKDSQVTSAIDTTPISLSWDKNGHTPWTGDSDNKLYHYSGQFTSTLKSSLGPLAEGQPRGISATADLDSPFAGRLTGKLYLYSGQFTSTIKTSTDISGLEGITENPFGLDWDGTDTFLSEEETDKLYILSGQFTTTVKDSEDITAVDNSIKGIGTNDATGHEGSGAAATGFLIPMKLW